MAQHSRNVLVGTHLVRSTMNARIMYMVLGPPPSDCEPIAIQVRASLASDGRSSGTLASPPRLPATTDASVTIHYAVLAPQRSALRQRRGGSECERPPGRVVRF